MTLKQGDTGSAVTDLQTKLGTLFFALAPDGVFGPRTTDAVRHFQLVCGLTVDGIAGPVTMAALTAGKWTEIHDNALVAMPQKRRQLTETDMTVANTDQFVADIIWYHVFEEFYYDTASLNIQLDAIAQSWIDDWKAQALFPVQPGESANSVNVELVANLIAPSLAAVSGSIREYISGAAHPNPRLTALTLDLPARRVRSGAELFVAGSNWPNRLRELVFFFGYDPADVAPASAQTFAKVVPTPSGVEFTLLPEDLNLPLAAGPQTFTGQWAKIESEIRPWVPARAITGSPGGPGPAVP